MKLTDEQKRAVNEPSSCLVKACPGSGKTRAIIAKLLNISEIVKNSTRRIACITYTNAAVGEIERRLDAVGGIPNGLCEISTIHTFCLTNILRPYAHLHDGIPSGFAILSPESSEFYSIGREVFGPQFESRFFRDRVLNIQWNRETDRLFVPEGVSAHSAEIFYAAIRELGLFTFGDIICFSEDLITRVPFIRRAIASRFLWIVVDEFQDTSPGQAAILQAVLSTGRTKVFLVGDENQSIYSFQNARPDLFRDFAATVGGIEEMSFTGNFRSATKVVALANQICASVPPMIAVGDYKDYPAIVEGKRTATAVEAVCVDFVGSIDNAGIEPGKCAVLAAAWYLLKPLGRALAMNGFSVSGPGARPYNWNYEFPALAEATAEAVMALNSESVARLERVVTKCAKTLGKGEDIQVSSWERRVAASTLRLEARRLSRTCTSGVQWLQEFAHAAGDILSKFGLIGEDGRAALLAACAVMVDRIGDEAAGNAHALSVADLALFGNPRNAIHLMTLHGSKGLEFDAVALVHLHETVIPNQYAVRTPEGIAEHRRLLYVGSTRARKLLKHYTHIDANRQQSRYLANLAY